MPGGFFISKGATMPTYKGKPVSAAKARFLTRKGIKLDGEPGATKPLPVFGDAPRMVMLRPEIRARATVNPTHARAARDLANTVAAQPAPLTLDDIPLIVSPGAASEAPPPEKAGAADSFSAGKPVLAAPLGGSPQDFDLSDEELERLTSPDTE